MKIKNLERMLKFLKSEEVIHDYSIKGKDITIVKLVKTEKEDFLRTYVFNEGFIDRDKFTISIEDNEIFWD